MKESTDLLKKIPTIEGYILNKITLSRDINKRNLRDYLPPQITSEDLKNVKIIASAKMRNKKNPKDEIYITVCDLQNVSKQNKFWNRIKEKISQSKDINGKINIFSTAKLNWFSFEITPDAYTFLKDKSEPELITILKTKRRYRTAISTFTKLFKKDGGLLKEKKVKDEIFLLPSTLPAGLKFQEFYLEKIPPEYIKEKPHVQWAKKMVGKLNLSAVYIDKSKTLWTINLFNMESEVEAKSVYDEYFSKNKEELLKMTQDIDSKSGEKQELIKSLLEMSGTVEPVTVKGTKGWFVENKVQEVNELSFRTSHYLITIYVNKTGQKNTLLQLAEMLQIKKIIKQGMPE